METDGKLRSRVLLQMVFFESSGGVRVGVPGGGRTRAASSLVGPAASSKPLPHTEKSAGERKLLSASVCISVVRTANGTYSNNHPFSACELLSSA